MLCDPVLMFYEQQPMSHVHVSAWADSIHWDYTLTSLPSWWVNTYHVEVRQPAGILIMCTPVSVHACIRQVIFSQCPPDPLTFDLQSYVDQRPKAAQTALNFKLFALDLSVFWTFAFPYQRAPSSHFVWTSKLSGLFLSDHTWLYLWNVNPWTVDTGASALKYIVWLGPNHV